MKCLKPIKVNGNYFNCGYCRNCRVNYTSQWTVRLLYELSNWFERGASFITLTYDDNHLPEDKSLHKEDLQKFWKILRYNLQNEYGNSKIKYYACGEYGSKTKRPHYHAIVFGLNSFSDKDRNILKQSWTKCESFLFDKNRKNSGMECVTRESIQYVTGYVQKKLNGQLAVDEYQDKLRPFSCVSRGMGLDFALEHSEMLVNNNFVTFGKHKIGIPRYFRDKLEISQKANIKRGFNLEDLTKSNELLFERFKEDMIRKNTWYPDNLTMMSIRFERWFNDYQWSYAQCIADDYLKYQQLRGKL